MDINGQESTFLSDTDYKIKNINNKKVSMHKILQNLKDLSPATSMSNGTKRIHTPPAVSKFELQIPEAKKQIETPNSKLDSKSKVRTDNQSVNILQCASDDSASGHKGEDCRVCYTPNRWSVTITSAAPSNPFNQGQRTRKSLLLPDQYKFTTGQEVQS